MLGTLIPMVVGYFTFGETVSWNQLVGFFILIVAVVIMCSYNNSINTKITPSSFLLLILCGCANGLTDFSQKMFIKSLPCVPVSVFNLYTYIFAVITLAAVYVFISLRASRNLKKGHGESMCIF